MVLLQDKIHIQQVIDGDTTAFTHLVNAYKDMVFTVCFRILRHREDAEDAAQTTFIKAFNNLHSFTGKSKFSTWLYTIAYRTAISSNRGQKLEFVSDVNISENVMSNSIAPEMNLEGKDKENYVRLAINSLSEIDGVLVSLFYMDECTIREICEITNLTESNVKVKLFRARNQLKVALYSLLQTEMNSL